MVLTNEEMIAKTREFNKKSGLPIKQIAQDSDLITNELYAFLNHRLIFDDNQLKQLNDYIDSYIARNPKNFI